MPSNEFSPTRLLDLSLLWRYLSYLIPYGMYPLLWVICYSTIIYLIFRPKFYHITFPILIFSLLYLYPMAKGYTGPYWARTAMPLFPGFCILIGVAFNDLEMLVNKNREGVLLLLTASLLLIFASIIFDVVYVEAMRQTDSRLILRTDLRNLIGTNSATIGVSRSGGYFYTAMPAAKPLKSEKVVVQLQDLEQQADFLLIGFGAPINSNQLDLTVNKVETQGKFRYDRSYSVRPRIFEKELRLARFPQDMAYPFPTILLFRHN